jgi:hypothetical protein
MAVGVSYLAKIQRAVRLVNPSAAIVQELTDTIEECRADLLRLGLPKSTATSETDYHILDAVKRYARWKFAADPYESARCADEYKEKADELRRMRDYAYLIITFVVTDADTSAAIEDAAITFNDRTIETDTDGEAIFRYVVAGQNKTYSIEADGYESASSEDLDVTASATVEVELTAV